MFYSKTEVFKIVSEVFGEKMNGVYLDSDFVFGESTLKDIFYSTNEIENGKAIRFVQNDKLRAKFFITAGTTKIVIAPVDMDYVIKIPVCGTCKAIEGIDLYKIDSVIYLDEDNIFDAEDFAYRFSMRDAKATILQNILVGEFNGIPIYVQEKVVHTGRDYGVVIPQTIKEINEIAGVEDEDDLNTYEPTFIYEVAKWYGIQTANALIHTDLSDIHGGNYGFLADGRPVVFDLGGVDYSSFREVE